MMVIGRSILFLASASLLTACATNERQIMVSPEQVEGKTWVLNSLNGKPPVDNRRITLQFESATDSGGRISGHGPCNSYFGTYSQHQNLLDFGTLSSTRMLCPEPVMTQEKDYLSAFQRVDVLNAGDDSITLKGESNVRMQFVGESAEIKGVIKSTTGSFPANSVVRVQIRDLTNPDDRASVIGESKITLKYQLDAPLKFNISYAPALVKPGHSYGMTVQVRQQGKLVSESVMQNLVHLQSTQSTP